jgi:hypothetical protein
MSPVAHVSRARQHASTRARIAATAHVRQEAEEESDKRLNRRETLEEAIDASSDVGEVLGLLVLRQVESRWQCSRPEDEVVGQERRRHGVHPYCPDQLACVAAHIHTTPARTPTGPVREATWLRRRLATSASFSSLSLHKENTFYASFSSLFLPSVCAVPRRMLPLAPNNPPLRGYGCVSVFVARDPHSCVYKVYAYRYILNLQPHLQPHLTSLSLTH